MNVFSKNDWDIIYNKNNSMSSDHDKDAVEPLFNFSTGEELPAEVRLTDGVILKHKDFQLHFTTLTFLQCEKIHYLAELGYNNNKSTVLHYVSNEVISEQASQNVDDNYIREPISLNGFNLLYYNYHPSLPPTNINFKAYPNIKKIKPTIFGNRFSLFSGMLITKDSHICNDYLQLRQKLSTMLVDKGFLTVPITYNTSAALTRTAKKINRSLLQDTTIPIIFSYSNIFYTDDIGDFGEATADLKLRVTEKYWYLLCCSFSRLDNLYEFKIENRYYLEYGFDEVIVETLISVNTHNCNPVVEHKNLFTHRDNFVLVIS